jgi:hypothetical protein
MAMVGSEARILKVSVCVCVYVCKRILLARIGVNLCFMTLKFIALLASLLIQQLYYAINRWSTFAFLRRQEFADGGGGLIAT